MHTLYTQESEDVKVITSPGTGLTEGCGLVCGCRKSNLGIPPGPVLLIAGPSFQPSFRDSSWAREMAQGVKAFAAASADFFDSLIPHGGKVNRFTQAIF